MRGCLQSKSRGEAFFLILIDSYVSICEMGVDLLPSYCTLWTFRAQKLEAQREDITCLGPYRPLVVELQNRHPWLVSC